MEASCVDISNELRQRDYPQSLPWYLPAMSNFSVVPRNSGSELLRADSTTTQSPYSQYWPADDVQLFSFAAAISTGTYHCEETGGPCEGALAVECRLWPAIQTFHARINRFELYEAKIQSQRLDFVPSRYGGGRYNLDSWLKIPAEVLQNGERKPCSSSSTFSAATPVGISNNTFWMQSSLTPSPEPDDLRWWPNECIWAVTTGQDFALSSFLDILFVNKTVSGWYGTGSDRSTWGEVWMKDLWRNGTADLNTVNTFAQQLAGSITTYMRNFNSSYVKTLYTDGDAIRTEVCIKVRWAWVAFPAGLTLLSIMFLGLTISKTRLSYRLGRAKGVWKSSSLAVLFAGLHEELRQECGALEKKSKIRHCAENLNVELRSTEHGWQLTRAELPNT
jgi:hypothetical protein